MTDEYWCNDGCGFVDKDHRCEQWSSTIRIPGEAIDRIRRECADKALAWLDDESGKDYPAMDDISLRNAIMGGKE